MPANPSQSLAYCGAPPLPEDLWSRWTLDPGLIALLLAVATAYALARRRATGPHRPTGRQAGAFHAGWGLVALCFLSPLCALSVALFSARVAQHMILMLVAAPLLSVGRPDLLLPRAVQRRLTAASRPLFAGLAFAAALWLWHAPAPYDASLRSDALYWLMHVTLLGSAFLFWHGHTLAATHGRTPAVALAGLVTAVHMGLLGALITFTGRGLYESHALTPLPWGLTALADQQLGGLIMWVPGGLAFLASALWAGAGLLRHEADSHAGPR